MGSPKYMYLLVCIAGKETDWFALNDAQRSARCWFQLMALVEGRRSELIAEGIRAPLILGLSGPPQRTIAVALTPSMNHGPLPSNGRTPSRKPHRASNCRQYGRCRRPMWNLCNLIWWAFIGLFRLRVALLAENLALRQQINVLRRTAPKRPRFGSIDRLIFVGLLRGLLPLATHWGSSARHRDPSAPSGV